VQGGIKRAADFRQFGGREQPLAAFEQLAFFFADVSGEELAEVAQASGVQLAPFRAGKIFAQPGMLGQQLLHQRLQFGESRGFGEENLLLGGEVPANFQVEHGADLRLQRVQVGGACLEGAVNLHAQRQRVLVLVRKRDQVAVAQHGQPKIYHGEMETRSSTSKAGNRTGDGATAEVMTRDASRRKWLSNALFESPRALLILDWRGEYLFALSAGKQQGDFMVATGELIRLMNYVDDISTTLRRIVATIPMMDDEERRRLSEYMRKVEPHYDSVLQQLEKGGK
jgi:hypothetical protein